MPYMKTNKTELRKNGKRKLIFQTAARVFAEKGYHLTTVKDITDTAGISVGTFYLYFKNKEDLFEKLYDEMEQLINNVKDYAYQKTATSASIRYANVITASLWTYQHFKELARILLIEAVGLNPRFEEKYTNIMIKSCESMEGSLRYFMENGFIQVPDTKIAAIAQEGSFNYAILYWLRTRNSTDLLQYAYPLVILSLQSLKMDFEPENIQSIITIMYQELETNAERFMQFQ